MSELSFIEMAFVGLLAFGLSVIFTICIFYGPKKKGTESEEEEGPEILHARSAVGSLVEGPLDEEEDETLFDEEHPADTMMFRNQEEDEEGVSKRPYTPEERKFIDEQLRED